MFVEYSQSIDSAHPHGSLWRHAWTRVFVIVSTSTSRFLPGQKRIRSGRLSDVMVTSWWRHGDVHAHNAFSRSPLQNALLCECVTYNRVNLFQTIGLSVVRGLRSHCSFPPQTGTRTSKNIGVKQLVRILALSEPSVNVKISTRDSKNVFS